MSKGMVASGRWTRWPAAGIGQAIIGAITLVIARMHQRRSLERLDDHLLRDIGLTRDDVRQEIEKPFWRG